MSTIVGTDIFLIARGTTNYQVSAADVAAFAAGPGAGVSSFSAGTTGFTPVAATTGAVTLAGFLNVANGGTGATTAAAALTNLLPAQAGNAGKFLTTDGTTASWGSPSGSNVQAAAAAPATRSDGTPLQAGDIYYNTTDRTLYTWNGTAWVAEVSGAVNIQVAAAAPATRSNGTPLQAGDVYYNTTDKTLYTYNGTAWNAQVGGGVNIQTAAAAPTTRSTGTALVAGDLYYNTATQQYFSWNGTAWVPFDQRNVVVTAVSATAKANDYVVVTAATQTITLPATPLVGACVTIVVAGTFTDTVVARNGSNIMGLAEDLTLDKAYAAMQFTYTDATNGWRLN